MFGPLQPGWLSTARASFRNDARRTRPSGRVTAEQQAAPTDSADQLGLVLNSWLALAHAMHAAGGQDSSRGTMGAAMAGAALEKRQ